MSLLARVSGCLLLLTAPVLVQPPDGLALEPRPGSVTAGAGLGLLGNTPDGTAFTLNGYGEQFVSSAVSIGPLAQLAFSGDLFLFGLSGQVKYWMDLPNTGHRAKLAFQAGLGFVHANVLRSDTSWLLPLGVGIDYALTPRLAVTGTFLLNFTNLQNTPEHGAHVMPSVTVGLRF